jgi:hypothetical protein
VIPVTHLPETVVNGKRLGRHIEHDHQSRGYSASKSLSLVDKSWIRYAAPFDQGDIGSCTGNAMAGCLVTEPFFSPGHKVDEALAVLIYSAATRLDYIAGHYPPTDTGSSGLACAKVAHKLGYISAYKHAFCMPSLLGSLSRVGPVMIGIGWYDSFDSPIGSGALLAISADAQVRGGHEVQLLGIDPLNRLVRGCNSWGDQWGDAGYFTMGFDTLDRLMSERGDCIVPLL